MKGLIFSVLLILTLTTYGQGTQERILYIVDSVSIIEDPDEEDGTLEETDIKTLTVVTNKEDIEKHGYKDLDKITFIVTKEFAKRPGNLKEKTINKANGK